MSLLFRFNPGKGILSYGDAVKFGIGDSGNDGTTLAKAAISAAAIKSAKPSSADGNYYILPTGQTTPILCYVSFSNSPTVGKGWVLVQRGRESTDYWNNNGQNYSTDGLTLANLNVNTPVACAPSAWVKALTGGWGFTTLLLNRPMTVDSYIYTGTNSDTYKTDFNWSNFNFLQSSAYYANYQRYTSMWGLNGGGTAATAGIGTNTTSWTDSSVTATGTAANGSGVTPSVTLSSNDRARAFCWTWANHGGYQGWSHGAENYPTTGFQSAGESHPITCANVYVLC